jgi:hypothetical protein
VAAFRFEVWLMVDVKVTRPRGVSKHHRMVYAWLTPESHDVLDELAHEHGEHVAVLVARCLERIAKPEVVAAILDDTR